MPSARTIFVTLVCPVLVLIVVGCAPTVAPAQPTAAKVEAATAVATKPVAPTAAVATKPPEPTAAAKAATGAWKSILQTEVEQPTRMAAFLNELQGFTGGANNPGRAHYTADGGKTWTLAGSSKGCIFSLDIVDIQTVWQAGLDGIALSEDKGQTWKGVAKFGNSQLISVVDAKTGWAGTLSQLGATTDAGATWTKLTLPTGIRMLSAILQRTANDGYVLDNGGTLYITADGGKTWSSNKLPVEKDWSIPELSPAAAIRFVDANRGVIVMNLVNGAKKKLLALRTTDGGKMWSQEEIAADNGVPYLTREANFLTIASVAEKKTPITVFRYQQ